MKPKTTKLLIGNKLIPIKMAVIMKPWALMKHNQEQKSKVSGACSRQEWLGFINNIYALSFAYLRPQKGIPM